MPQSTCQLHGCGADLSGKRKGARYCSDDHRREAWKRRHNVEGAERFWSRMGRRARLRPAVRV